MNTSVGQSLLNDEQKRVQTAQMTTVAALAALPAVVFLGWNSVWTLPALLTMCVTIWFITLVVCFTPRWHAQKTLRKMST